MVAASHMWLLSIGIVANVTGELYLKCYIYLSFYLNYLNFIYLTNFYLNSPMWLLVTELDSTALALYSDSFSDNQMDISAFSLSFPCSLPSFSPLLTNSDTPYPMLGF